MSDISTESALYDAPFDPTAQRQTPAFESEPAAEAVEGNEPPVEEPARREFDPRMREALTGLVYLGYLEDTFDYLGHTFTVRTMTAGEKVKAGMLIKPSLGTRQEMSAWQIAVVASSLTSVDGQPLVVPLVATADPSMEERYNVVAKWYPAIISEVYRRQSLLEDAAGQVMTEMGEAQSRGSLTSG